MPLLSSLGLFTRRRRSPAPSQNAAQTRIASSFRGYLARRPTNSTTLNAIPGRRRVHIGQHAHDANSIAELMRRENWRDPLTRTPLTNAQAAQAWRLHTRNRAAEARREGRQYAAPPMPQRPHASLGGARQSEIAQWYHGNAPGTGLSAAQQRQLNAAVMALRDRVRRDKIAAKSALKRAWIAILQTPGREGYWQGRNFFMQHVPQHLLGTLPQGLTTLVPRPYNYVFEKNNQIIAFIAATNNSAEVRTPQGSLLGLRWSDEMSRMLTRMLRSRGF